MIVRRAAVALVAIGALAMAACSGDVGLPAPVEAPASTRRPWRRARRSCRATRRAASAAARDAPGYNATRSYAPTGPLPAAGQMPAGSTMAEIVANGKLRVGVSADTLLFGYRNPFTGAIEGFDIDMLTYVAQALFGGTFAEARDKIEFRVITYAQRLPSLQRGDVDLVAHTMTINCVRWQQIAFSSEYFSAGQRVLVKVGSGFDDIDALVAPRGRRSVHRRAARTTTS